MRLHEITKLKSMSSKRIEKARIKTSSKVIRFGIWCSSPFKRWSKVLPWSGILHGAFSIGFAMAGCKFISHHTLVKNFVSDNEWNRCSSKHKGRKTLRKLKFAKNYLSSAKNWEASKTTAQGDKGVKIICYFFTIYGSFWFDSAVQSSNNK